MLELIVAVKPEHVEQLKKYIEERKDVGTDVEIVRQWQYENNTHLKFRVSNASEVFEIGYRFGRYEALKK
jgi:hypothetical protein